MRAIIDAILILIGSASLTDEEYESITLEAGYTQAELYEAINTILVARDGVSTSAQRLYYYFLAIGATISQIESPKSNIFIGAVCEQS